VANKLLKHASSIIVGFDPRPFELLFATYAAGWSIWVLIYGSKILDPLTELVSVNAFAIVRLLIVILEVYGLLALNSKLRRIGSLLGLLFWWVLLGCIVKISNYSSPAIPLYVTTSMVACITHVRIVQTRHRGKKR